MNLSEVKRHIQDLGSASASKQLAAIRALTSAGSVDDSVINSFVSAGAAMAIVAVVAAGDRSWFCSSGHLQRVVPLLGSSNSGVRKFAGFALREVAEAHAVEVERAGAVPGLVKLLGSNYVADENYEACGALKQLTFHTPSSVRNSVVAHGAIPALIKLLDPGRRSDLHIEAVGTLMNLTGCNTEHANMIVDAGAIKPLAQLLSSTEPGVLSRVGAALGNMAGMRPSNCAAIAAAGAVPKLAKLVEHAEGPVRQSSITALSNMLRSDKAQIPAIARALMEPAPLRALLRQLHRPDVDGSGRMFASMVLYHIANHDPAAHARLLLAAGWPAAVLTMLSVPTLEVTKVCLDSTAATMGLITAQQGPAVFERSPDMQALALLLMSKLEEAKDVSREEGLGGAAVLGPGPPRGLNRWHVWGDMTQQELDRVAASNGVGAGASSNAGGSSGASGSSSRDAGATAAAAASDQDAAAGAAVCSGCGKAESSSAKLKLCRGCRAACYCDADCQKSHWKEHKQACKAAQAAR